MMKRSKKDQRNYDCVMDTFEEIYKMSTPSVSFKQLVNECKDYEDRNGNKIHLDEHLSEDEIKARGLRYDVKFEKYSVKGCDVKNAINEMAKKYKLKKIETDWLKNNIYLGPCPNVVD